MSILNRFVQSPILREVDLYLNWAISSPLEKRELRQLACGGLVGPVAGADVIPVGSLLSPLGILCGLRSPLVISRARMWKRDGRAA